MAFLKIYTVFHCPEILERDKDVYDDKVIEDRDKALITGVVDTFADYSASEIMRLSHKQEPWKYVFSCR